MVTEKSSTKGSTFEESPPQNDTCYKLYGKEKVLERMARNKCPTQTWHPKKQLIAVANEDHVSIVESGNVQLQSSLSPHNYLATGRIIGISKEQGRLYYLQHTKIGNNTNKEDLPSSQRATLETWTTSQIWFHHKRLGHLSFSLFKTMIPHLFTKEFVESFHCDLCQFSKHHPVTFSPNNNKVLFFLTLFILMCGNQLVTLYRGLNERKNCYLLEVVRVLLFQISIPNLNICYPSFFFSLHVKPFLFGCVAFVYSHNPHRGKLDSRVVKCVFIGYLSNKKRFKCYHPLSR
ncbi:hypothetical protein CR513_05764, partial [Mucuna pruriens]